MRTILHGRILRQQKRVHPPKLEPQITRKVKVKGDFRLSKITWKGLRALYFFYLRKLREAQRQPVGYAPYILREDLRLMDAISEQSKFVFKYKLDTAEQVEALKSSLITHSAALLKSPVFFRIKILLCVIGKEVIEKGDLYGNGNHAAAFKSTPCVYSKRNR